MSATARTSIYVGYPRAQEQSAAVRLYELLALAELKDCTIHKAVGFWRGKAERCFIIEIIGDSSEDDFNITFLADSLKNSRDFPQEAVYIVQHFVDLVVV